MGSDRSKGKCGISENSYLSWVKGVFKLSRNISISILTVNKIPEVSQREISNTIWRPVECLLRIMDTFTLPM